jgi:hypothetical protein
LNFPVCSDLRSKSRLDLATLLMSGMYLKWSVIRCKGVCKYCLEILKVLFWVIKLAALTTGTLDGNRFPRNLHEWPYRCESAYVRDAKYLAKLVLFTLSGKLAATGSHGTSTNGKSMRTCLLS